nr:copia protein [Tanacetum cinerariifolium]
MVKQEIIFKTQLVYLEYYATFNFRWCLEEFVRDVLGVTTAFIDLNSVLTTSLLLEKESIDYAFARFNTIITSLEALDEGYSSKKYVRKFLWVLHPKWREKVTSIEDSKDLTSLSLDELIGNLKAKKEYSDEECSTYGSEDEDLDDKNDKSDRKCFRCADLNHLIRECPKSPKDKNQRVFVGGSWSDSGKEDDENVRNETCLVAQASSEKQSVLAISTTEAEYVSARKACQQALWMKQATIDYDVRLDDVPIMRDNKGTIDLSKNPVQHSRTKHVRTRKFR